MPKVRTAAVITNRRESGVILLITIRMRNNWYYKGHNLRTNGEGLFPSYKVNNVVVYF
jgi:hypothetical protein